VAFRKTAISLISVSMAFCGRPCPRKKWPRPPGEFLQPVVLLQAALVNSRQVNCGAGDLLDPAGNPAVIGVEMSEEDSVDVFCRLPEVRQRLVEAPCTSLGCS